MPSAGDVSPRLCRRGRPMLGDGLRPQPPGDSLRRAAGVDGRWRSPKGDRWLVVWACPDHLNGVTGLREFGRQREARSAPN